MGTIARQSIKGSIYSYLGMALGFVNVALLMPKLFLTDEIGLINILLALSAIFGQFGCLGINTYTIKEFPHFRDKKDNGFLLFILLIGSMGFILCLAFFLAFKTEIIENNIEKSPLFTDYVYLLIPFIFFTIFQYIVDTYNRILFNASFGLFVKEFFQRILIFIGIIAFWLGIFNYNYFVLYYTICFGVPLFCICLLLIIKGQFSLKPSSDFLKAKVLKNALNISFYGLVAGVSAVMATQVDKYLVYQYCDLQATGIYATAFFFGSAIIIPGRSLIRISASMISEALKKNEIKTIETIYKRSTSSLLIAGTGLFLIIWSNINNIMQYLPAEYEMGRYVIFFIGLSFYIQTIAGANVPIIQYSKYYKVFSLFTLIVVGVTIILNIILIPKLGITGAAITSAIAFFIDFILRTAFVKIKFKIHTFSIDHLKICFWGLLAYLISCLIPEIYNIYIDSAVRTSILCLVYGIPVLYFKYSIDLNNSIIEIILKIKLYLRNK